MEPAVITWIGEAGNEAIKVMNHNFNLTFPGNAEKITHFEKDSGTFHIEALDTATSLGTYQQFDWNEEMERVFSEWPDFKKCKEQLQ